MKLAPLLLASSLAVSLAPSSGAMAAPRTIAGAPSGFAYDSVMKFQPSGDDPSTIVPGNFAADFQTASQPPAKPSGGGGMFGLGKMLASAQSAMSMFGSGTATRHYLAGTKERLDTPALQTAVITDCAARTITTLDLAKRTYTVVSMDQPIKSSGGSGSGSHEKPGPAATDDGTRYAIAFTTSSLGAKTLDSTPTTGYDADMKMTATRPTGETSTMDMAMVAYYTAMAEPALSCPASPLATSKAGPGGAQGAAMMAQYALAMRALRTPKGDPRFTVSQSGPPLPAGKFSMFNVFALKSAQGKGAFNIIEERGDAHAISADDPIFSVPSDFTKIDA